MREFAERFYKSKAWQQCRDGYVASVGGLCEQCRKRGLIRPAEIVHHKIHLTPENINNPAVSLDWHNLEALCRECHGEKHKKIKKRYKIDENGKLVAKLESHE